MIKINNNQSCKKNSKYQNQKKNFNFNLYKNNTIKSLNEVEYFLNNFNNFIKYIKLYKILK